MVMSKDDLAAEQTTFIEDTALRSASTRTETDYTIYFGDGERATITAASARERQERMMSAGIDPDREDWAALFRNSAGRLDVCGPDESRKATLKREYGIR